MKKENKQLKLFIESLSGKTFNELEPMMQSLVKELFRNYDSDSIFEVTQLYGEQANLMITYKETNKFVLLRNADENIMKYTKIDKLCDKLLEMGIDKDTVNFIKFYHYGDNSFDGSGKKSMTNEEVKFRYQSEITYYNKVLNDEHLIAKLVDYFVFTNDEDPERNVELVIYYDDAFQTFARKEEVVLYNMQNKCNYLRNLHVSNLLISPLTRANLSEKDSEKRKVVAIRWYNFGNCISQIHFARFFKSKIDKRQITNKNSNLN